MFSIFRKVATWGNSNLSHLINHGIKSDQLQGQHLWICIQNYTQRWPKIVVVIVIYCRKFNYFFCNLSAGAVKPFNDILGRNTDHLTCIDIMNIDYIILQCNQLGITLHYKGQ